MKASYGVNRNFWAVRDREGEASVTVIGGHIPLDFRIDIVIQTQCKIYLYMFLRWVIYILHSFSLQDLRSSNGF